MLFINALSLKIKVKLGAERINEERQKRAEQKIGKEGERGLREGKGVIYTVIY